MRKFADDLIAFGVDFVRSSGRVSIVEMPYAAGRRSIGVDADQIDFYTMAGVRDLCLGEDMTDGIEWYHLLPRHIVAAMRCSTSVVPLIGLPRFPDDSADVSLILIGLFRIRKRLLQFVATETPGLLLFARNTAQACVLDVRRLLVYGDFLFRHIYDIGAAEEEPTALGNLEDFDNWYRAEAAEKNSAAEITLNKSGRGDLIPC